MGRIAVGATDGEVGTVKQGAGRVYRNDATDPPLDRLEAQANAVRRGRWGVPEPAIWPRGDGQRGMGASAGEFCSR